MNCPHQHAQADFKVSHLAGGETVACFRVWCSDCFTDFQVTDDIQTSADLRQMMVRIEPMKGMVAPVNFTEH